MNPRFRIVFILIFVSVFALFSTSCIRTKHIDKITGRTLLNENDGDIESGAAENEIKPPQIVTVEESGPLTVTAEEAVLIALENNRSLVVERFNTEIMKTYQDQELAAFDPVVSAEVSAEKNDIQRLSGSGSDINSTTTEIYQGDISLSDFFPTGTFVEIDAEFSNTDSEKYEEIFATSRLGLSVTQPLLRGSGTDANLVQLRQARLDTDISRFELRGYTESLVADVENAFWDFALAQRRIEIYEGSLQLSKRQLAETEEMIRVGSLAESELAAVQAEVAVQQQELINAKSALESKRFYLLSLLNPPGKDKWGRKVELVYAPTLPEIKLDDVNKHIETALKMRPEINQAKRDIQRGELEIVRTKNGLLPRMDLFITLGKTGYANSFFKSVGDIPRDGYDALIGVNLEYPISNRDARARHSRAMLQRNQAEKALSNLIQLVELDVLDAYIEIQRTKDQIAASVATKRLQEEKLRIETEKFRVGRSTNLMVSQAQRDLLGSRIDEVEAVINYIKALINFHHMEGTVLEHRGVVAPGRNPVE